MTVVHSGDLMDIRNAIRLELGKIRLLYNSNPVLLLGNNDVYSALVGELLAALKICNSVTVKIKRLHKSEKVIYYDYPSEFNENPYFKGLTAREIFVLYRREIGDTLKFISLTLGVSRERVRQIEIGALRAIRRAIELKISATPININ